MTEFPGPSVAFPAMQARARLKIERKRHEMAIAAVIESIERGECDSETGTEALFTLSDWYEVTGMSIQRAIPKWMWRSNDKEQG